MTIEQIVLLAISGIPLALVFANKLRLDVAALAIAAALGLAQLAGLSMFGPPHTPQNAVRAIAGFSQPVVLTLFSLFVLTSALERSGVARWLASHIVTWGGASERRLIVLFAGASAALSIFMNNLAAAALLLPSAIDASRRTGVKTSKLLIPVAYGSLLGGVATYFTTANIIVSDILTSASPPQKPLHILDFTPTGGLIAIAGILFLAIFGPRLLPNRDPKIEQTIVRRSGRELMQHYSLSERLWELRVLSDDVHARRIAIQLGVAIVAIWRGEYAIFAPSADETLQAGDLLLVVGREERVRQIEGVEIGRNHDAKDLKGVMLIETMIAPQSRLEGRTLRELEFRKNYGFTAVALLRQQRSYRTDVSTFKLQAGDSLLLVGSPDRLPLLRKVTGLIVFEPDPSDLPIQRGTAIASVAILSAAIIASIAKRAGLSRDPPRRRRPISHRTLLRRRSVRLDAMAGAGAGRGYVLSKPRHGSHRPRRDGERFGGRLGRAIWRHRARRRRVPAERPVNADHRRTGRSPGHRSHHNRRRDPAASEPSSSRSRDRHRLFRRLPHAHRPPGQPAHDRSRQLRVQGFLQGRPAPDNHLFRRPDRWTIPILALKPSPPSASTAVFFHNKSPECPPPRIGELRNIVQPFGRVGRPIEVAPESDPHRCRHLHHMIHIRHHVLERRPYLAVLVARAFRRKTAIGN
jgi:di/tricarboxylate transporter